MLLKEWRWMNYFSQAQLAEKLGCSQSEITQIENNYRDGYFLKDKFLSVFGEEQASKINEFKKL
jgi:transcriptional regulator with XRE-family HTH domain